MKKEDIDILLKKYYEGLSSDEDEKLLKDFFNSTEIPAGYETEKALFRYYSDISSILQASEDFEERIIISIDNVSLKNSGFVKKLAIIISGIAAGLLILASSWLFFNRNKPVDTFTDPAIAYAETMKILYEVSSRMNKGTAVLEPVSKMNLAGVKGLDALARSRETLEKSLGSLDYIGKVIEITDLSENKEKR